jgi:branched-chain amino acid transport system substrate-binding protein
MWTSRGFNRHRSTRLLLGVAARALGIALAWGALSSTAWAQADPGVTPEKIVIGTHLPLTGPVSSVGLGFRAGVQMALAEINAHGGVNGRMLEVVFEDDAGTAEGAISAVRRLLDRSNVFGILSGGSSTSVVAVIPLVQQRRVPYLASLASDPRVLEKFSPYVFTGSTVARGDVAVAVTGFMTGTLHTRTISFLHSGEANCQSGVDILATTLTQAGVETKGRQRFNTGDTDFTAQAHALVAQDADTIYICGIPADGGRILPQLRRAGIKAKLVGDTALADPNTIVVAGKDAEGFFTFWGAKQFIEDRTGVMGQWRERFQQAVPDAPRGTPNLFSLAGYGDFYVFAEGLRRAGKNPTREGFVQGTEGIRDFVAGKDAYWTFASPIALPRNFAPDNHKGNRDQLPVVVKNGQLVSAVER